MRSLTQRQKSILIGTLLGDGYLRIVPGRKNALLEVSHSVKQKEYVDWKYQELKNLVKSPPKRKKGNEGRVAYRFFTRQHPELTGLHQRFYPEGSKIIPEDLKLDSLTIAVWFMDDGSKCSESDIYFNTQQFEISDQQKLIAMLSKVGIKARINKDKTYFRLRLLKRSIVTLEKMIDSHVVPSMRYKLSKTS